MRAAVVRAFSEDLSIETVADPACPDNGVVLEVAACGVCRSDYHGWTGEHPRVQSGSILGHEYCGTVVAAGPSAKYAVGDRLIAPFILSCGDCPACHTGVSNTCENQIVPGFGVPGAYAEYVAVPFDHNLVHLPETMTPALAAGLGCRVTTAWHALTGSRQCSGRRMGGRAWHRWHRSCHTVAGQDAWRSGRGCGCCR